MFSSVIATFIRYYMGTHFLLRNKIYITEIYKQTWGRGGSPYRNKQRIQTSEVQRQTVWIWCPILHSHQTYRVALQFKNILVTKGLDKHSSMRFIDTAIYVLKRLYTSSSLSFHHRFFIL